MCVFRMNVVIFLQKSRSISTDNLGKLNIVKFIAVSLFNARQADKRLSFSKKLSTSASLHTFSKVSLTNPSSFACLPIVFLSNLSKKCAMMKICYCVGDNQVL